MQKLVEQAITTGAEAIDPDALAEQVALYRSAAQIGINQTAARSTAVMQKHNALARRLRDRPVFGCGGQVAAYRAELVGTR